MGVFFASLVGSIFAPSPTLRHVARRRSLVDSIAALLVLTAALIGLSVRSLNPDTSSPDFWHDAFRVWLRSSVVVLAVWLFYTHLLWRAGGLLGGHGRLRTVAATTAMALTGAGLLAGLAADAAPWWAALPLLLWCFWIMVTSVRRAHRFSYARAVAATLIAAAVTWACYAAALPWRFERVGVAALLRLWRVTVPGQHLLWPNTVILAGLVLLTLAMIPVAAAGRRWLVYGGLGLTAAALAVVGGAGWFVHYYGRFLNSPVDQPQTVTAADGGGLFVRGAGGAARLGPDGAVRWQRREADDGVLAGADGTALVLRGPESEILVLAPDGSVLRTLTVPGDVPFDLACRLGDVTADPAGRLILLAGPPIVVHRISLEADRVEDEVIADVGSEVSLATDTPLSFACGMDGSLYVAERSGAGRRVLRAADPDAVPEVIHETSTDAEERWRLTAGRDGAVYLACTHLDGHAVTRWQVWRVDAGGEPVEAFTKSQGDPDCPLTPNPSFAVDADGRLYAADLDGFRILVFDAHGTRVATLPPNPWYRRLAVFLTRRAARRI